TGVQTYALPICDRQIVVTDEGAAGSGSIPLRRDTEIVPVEVLPRRRVAPESDAGPVDVANPGAGARPHGAQHGEMAQCDSVRERQFGDDGAAGLGRKGFEPNGVGALYEHVQSRGHVRLEPAAGREADRVAMLLRGEPDDLPHSSRLRERIPV